MFYKRSTLQLEIDSLNSPRFRARCAESNVDCSSVKRIVATQNLIEAELLPYNDPYSQVHIDWTLSIFNNNKFSDAQSYMNDLENLHFSKANIFN